MTPIDLSKIQVSWYFGHGDTTSNEPMKLSEFFAPQPKLDPFIDKIRATTDETKRKALKAQLPGITPSGLFNERKDSALKRYSGLVALDFDHLNDSVDDVKEYISQLPYIVYCGLSASGRGLWALVRVLPQPEHHAAIYEALIEDFAEIGRKVDSTGRNISRFRYYSYDTNAHWNLNAEYYTRKKEQPKAVIPAVSHHEYTSCSHAVNKLRKAIREAPDGQKHYVLLRTANAAGKYIRDGLLSYEEAAHWLQHEISQRSVRSLQDAFKTIDDGLKYGMR